MKRFAVILLCLIALVPVASAVTDYLSAYSSWVSLDAFLSAKECSAPVELSPEELSIFRLGYACGYDSARVLDSFRAVLPDDLSAVQTRSGIDPEEGQKVYIINTESGKFHVAGCSAERKILPEHRKEIVATFEAVCNLGYSPCGICLRNPN